MTFQQDSAQDLPPGMCSSPSATLKETKEETRRERGREEREREARGHKEEEERKEEREGREIGKQEERGAQKEQLTVRTAEEAPQSSYDSPFTRGTAVLIFKS